MGGRGLQNHICYCSGQIAVQFAAHSYCKKDVGWQTVVVGQQMPDESEAIVKFVDCFRSTNEVDNHYEH